MLAFRSALPTTYDSLLTLASLLIAIFVTGAGFCIADSSLSKWTSIAAGSVIGTGIAMMHYLGMSAMSISGHIRWDPLLVVASITMGILFSAAATWSFKVKQSKLLAAGLLTAAVCTLHFTAMGAAVVEFDPTVIVTSPHIDNKLLATAIAGVTVLVILSGLTAVLINLEMARESQERINLLRQLADHDHLTGLPNRGFISQTIDRSINCVSGSGFALFFVDLDRFKGINDKFGHLAGDTALVTFCRLATSQLRPTDLFGRIGGEEFASLLPDTTRQDALQLAERLRAAFEVTRHTVAEQPFTATVSVGVATSDDASFDLSALLVAADQALYRAKALGRNRVELSTLSLQSPSARHAPGQAAA